MAPIKTINLIQTATPMSPQLESVTVFVKKLSFWALVILIVSGVVVSGVYYFLQIRERQLVQTQQQLSGEIAQSTTKEGLLFVLKQRTLVTNKILSVQTPVSKVFNTIATVVPSGQISALSLDDHNNVLLTLNAPSIADVVSMTDALSKQVTARTVRSPELVSLSLRTNGSVDVSVSFIAVF